MKPRTQPPSPRAIATLALVCLTNGCASPEPGALQVPAEGFKLPATGLPRYEPDHGPRVAVDEAHFNYHTIGHRYRPFGDLLRRDGYRVAPFREAFSRGALENTDLLVISNALSEEGQLEWSLPDDSAFTKEEIEALAEWVSEGGRLLLIADHMPLPGHAADLAEAFGVLFHDGFAFDPEGRGRITFSRADVVDRVGLLAEHPITSAPGVEIPFVTTFMGQAFRLRAGVDAAPLMILPEGSRMLLPSVSWEFSERTPHIPAEGLLQGVVLKHGQGRVAVFGEAAAFTAQVRTDEDGVIEPMGMSHPTAPHNARFVLNVVAWLVEGVASRPETKRGHPVP